MPQNFRKYIRRLDKHHQQTGECTLEFGNDRDAWVMIYCSAEKQQAPTSEGRYYAMPLASANAHGSTLCCVRRAYRIDPLTGKKEVYKTRQSTIKGKKLLPEGRERLFAVKEFIGPDIPALEKIACEEAEALSRGQFMESAVVLRKGKQPMIISDYYLGQGICLDDGKPNKQLINKLNTTQRLNAVLQLALQFQRIHQHPTYPMIHRDIKGQNALLLPSPDGVWHAMVIDFGSAIDIAALTSDQKSEPTVATALGRLTLSFTPPEAISTVSSSKPSIGLDEIAGYLSRKSDIYTMAPLFAALLGATDPLRERKEEQQIGDQVQMSILRRQIRAGFDFTGVLKECRDRDILHFSLESCAQPCGFYNRSQVETPNDHALLRAENGFSSCAYILYKNDLIYVDKELKQVHGRSRYKKIRVLREKVVSIQKEKDTSNAGDDLITTCTQITGKAHRTQVAIHDILQGLVESFLMQMSHKESDERPSSDEVVRFFTHLQRLCHSIEAYQQAAAEARDPIHILDKRLKIILIQLHLIYFKLWNTGLPVESLTGEVTHSSFSQYDFTQLEENQSDFNRLWNMFIDPNLHDGTTAASSLDFTFLKITSQERNIEDLILSKLTQAGFACSLEQATTLCRTPPADERKEDEALPTSSSHFGAYDLLSLSPHLLYCLLTRQVDPGFFNGHLDDAILFIEKIAVIDHFAPTVCSSMVKQLGEKLPLLQTVAALHGEVIDLLTGHMQDPEPILAAYSSTALFDLIDKIEQIGHPLMSQDSLNATILAIKTQLLKAPMALLSCEQEKPRAGLFSSPKLSQKDKDAVSALINAVNTGQYQPLLENAAYTHLLSKPKTAVGTICQPYIAAIMRKNSPLSGPQLAQ